MSFDTRLFLSDMQCDTERSNDCKKGRDNNTRR
jgi:hypothetical protein